MNRLPRWRIAVAVTILVVLAVLLAVFAPIYYHNLQLQNFVGDVTHRVENQTSSDDVLRSMVADRAHELGLPVSADNVHILRADGKVQKIEVRYFVRVNLPGYTVDLHFYPGAGSR